LSNDSEFHGIHLAKFGDDESLAGLLEFSELLANINQDAILCLVLYT